jgi:hypothetical protein
VLVTHVAAPESVMKMAAIHKHTSVLPVMSKTHATSIKRPVHKMLTVVMAMAGVHYPSHEKQYIKGDNCNKKDVS